MQIEPGGPGYVGFYYFWERGRVVGSIEPVTLNGLDTAVWLCDPNEPDDVDGWVEPEDELLAGCMS